MSLAWFFGVTLFLVGLNVATIVLVLALLGGKEDRFVTWRQMSQLIGRVANLEKGSAALYRYLEAVDEATGADGYKVLSSRMSGHDTAA